MGRKARGAAAGVGRKARLDVAPGDADAPAEADPVAAAIVAKERRQGAPLRCCVLFSVHNPTTFVLGFVSSFEGLLVLGLYVKGVGSIWRWWGALRVCVLWPVVTGGCACLCRGEGQGCSCRCCEAGSRRPDHVLC